MVAPLILAAGLSLIHLLSEWFDGHVKRWHGQIVSLSAGVFIAFMFIVLLPQLTVGTAYLGGNIYALALAGFIAYYLGEKYLYQHITNRKALMSDLAHAHLAGFFVDGLVVGMSLVLFIDVYAGANSGIIFIPLALHIIASTISSRHIHEHFRSGIAEKVLLSSAPLIGAFFAYTAGFEAQHFYLFFAPLVGALFYVVARGVVPREGRGNALFFLAGALLGLMLLKVENVGLL